MILILTIVLAKEKIDIVNKGQLPECQTTWAQ